MTNQMQSSRTTSFFAVESTSWNYLQQKVVDNTAKKFAVYVNMQMHEKPFTSICFQTMSLKIIFIRITLDGIHTEVT